MLKKFRLIPELFQLLFLKLIKKKLRLKLNVNEWIWMNMNEYEWIWTNMKDLNEYEPIWMFTIDQDRSVPI